MEVANEVMSLAGKNNHGVFSDQAYRSRSGSETGGCKTDLRVDTSGYYQ
jgi:hypothetical protein